MEPDDWKRRQAARDRVLGYLYAESDFDIPSRDVCEAVGIDFAEFKQHVYEDLKEEGFVKAVAVGGERGFTIKLTPAGLLAAEEVACVDPGQRSKLQAVRLALLRRLATSRAAQGGRADISIWELSDDREDLAVVRGLQALQHQGMVEERFGQRFWRITRHGMETLARVDARAALAAKLADIELLSPQQRGKALEGLLASVLREQGWQCDEDTGGQGEQIDLVVYSGTSYFVCESKWEKEPTQGKVVDQMATRLRRRPPFFVGVIFSMSNFTSGAYHNATRELGDRAILLIGADDTRALIRGEKRFVELVNEQLRQIATKAEH